MSNLAQEGYREDFGYEILNGKIVNMAPASSGHTSVVGAIHAALYNFLRRRPCKVYVDGLMVYFSENDKVVPDVMVICRPEIIKDEGVFGAPDLVVEVLSPSTALKDKSYKKNLYEKNGVREYWIVDPRGRSIEVFKLIAEKYDIDQIYTQHTSADMKLLSMEERKQLPQSIQSCIFPDLSIPLEDIFEDL